MPAPDSLPLVTIVALCHNHARFLRPALDSILAQTYPNLEVFLVDDGSSDDSVAVLREYAAAHPAWHTVFLPENIGNCAAFNRAFFQSRGEFVIDFATDDILLPTRVARQVAYFQELDASYGMLYGNLELLSEDGRFQRLHHRPDAKGRLQPFPAAGWVFEEVLRRFFISAPSMMMRRATLLELGGYDETLTYEDFDFWVRASRNWQFAYQDEVLTQKRLHPRSKSAQSYRPHDPFIESTMQICRKAAALCRTASEWEALRVRLRWEMRQAARFGSIPQARQLYALLREIGGAGWVEHGIAAWLRVRHPRA
ncbi:glycosyltransferase family 2 protein [Hymenobacter psychrotolerans]|uniref:Glycosyltransferase like family 2 n=1 Tax=Hymenobacter psychrotolerans DSM 18569 TaxID=1121959 RepID=A0A1M6T149_9BACT|nr:glycosyltransferase [Hymenobacter psychrotolerans]SHK50661.1 Glycosyltransferase like family 2 [Hymenobacter psychrotolerans DSM 18569]